MTTALPLPALAAGPAGLALQGGALARLAHPRLRPLKAAIQKMKKLSFLDPSVEGAVTLVSDILKALPQEGYIQGQSSVTLEKLVEVMSETDLLLNAASKVKNGVPACDVLFPPMPVQAVQAVEEVLVEEAVQTAAPLTEVMPVAPVVVPPVSVVPQQVVMLPPIPASGVSDTRVKDKLGQLGITPMPAPVRAAPVLRPREALKTNSLMF